MYTINNISLRINQSSKKNLEVQYYLNKRCKLKPVKIRINSLFCLFIKLLLFKQINVKGLKKGGSNFNGNIKQKCLALSFQMVAMKLSLFQLKGDIKSNNESFRSRLVPKSAEVLFNE